MHKLHTIAQITDNMNEYQNTNWVYKTAVKSESAIYTKIFSVRWFINPEIHKFLWLKLRCFGSSLHGKRDAVSYWKTSRIDPDFSQTLFNILIKVCKLKHVFWIFLAKPEHAMRIRAFKIIFNKRMPLNSLF